MFISRECDYAIRVIRALAGSGRKAVGEICESELIPRQYAYKIIKKLEKAELVTIYRGASGGYELAKELGDITLLDIITAVDEGLQINKCLEADYCCPRNSGENHCSVHDELFRVQDAIIAVLSEKSISDVLF